MHALVAMIVASASLSGGFDDVECMTIAVSEVTVSGGKVITCEQTICRDRVVETYCLDSNGNHCEYSGDIACTGRACGGCTILSVYQCGGSNSAVCNDGLISRQQEW